LLRQPGLKGLLLLHRGSGGGLFGRRLLRRFGLQGGFRLDVRRAQGRFG
ncbi:MAG: hypothetical protein GWO00_03250, partial [Gemmatimonadetes bacterium]|nr:hypothetical protein [Gemmatimonadota bacterium]NIT86016.1 hypothetical protein [Gemmatimonadota bacterium]NIU29836.1 hypothetical protein [Gemmatimonadota bacterium]NIV60245.1 hypothetical protein [Gemmatimonadota bacterium]NIW62906.1 hypothetical protein [Gemmatimonadota bacterium]